MNPLAPVIARVLLRYAGGALLGMAWLSEDPDVAAVVTAGVGALMAVAAEVWMMVARRYGWAR